jgi:hypothetical protein
MFSGSNVASSRSSKFSFGHRLCYVRHMTKQQTHAQWTLSVGVGVNIVTCVTIDGVSGLDI